MLWIESSQATAMPARERSKIKMNTSTCIKLGVEEGFFHDGREPRDGEVIHLVEKVLRSLDAACGEATWPAFKSRLRREGPELREAIEKLREIPIPAAPDHERSCLADELLAQGVPEPRVDCVEHAERTMLRAHTIAHMLDEHSTGNTSEHIQHGDRAMWMYGFARLALWQVASGKVATDAPCLRFAIKLAVDEARDAYAYYATALEQGNAA